MLQGIDVLLGNHQFVYFFLQLEVFFVGSILGRKDLGIFFAEFFHIRQLPDSI